MTGAGRDEVFRHVVKFPSALLAKYTQFKAAGGGGVDPVQGTPVTLVPHPRALPSAGKEARGELFQGADPAGNHN